ncbi:Two-component sensor kinase N-terminal [Bradyrhizobium sp. Gha]|nr:Two-component sensor kinase N-terminal [Bradyrhizobium sp. Gha]
MARVGSQNGSSTGYEAGAKARAPSFKSLISRIVFLHIIAVAVVAIFLPLVLFWLLNSEIDQLHRAAMRAQAEALAERIAVQGDGKVTFNLPESLRGLYSEAYGRYQYDIRDGDGRLLFSSHRKTGDVGSDTISGAGVTQTIGGTTVHIRVGEDLSHRDVITDDIVSNFFRRVGWITIPILLILLAIDIIIFRRAIAPLWKASEQASNIGPARTDIRLPIERIPREIVPLVTAVNQALDRLEDGFRVQRQFTADAAHQLRTPLAILRTRIEMLGDREARQALHDDIAGMSRIVAQLLEIAELDTLVLDPGETADLRAVCAEVVGRDRAVGDCAAQGHRAQRRGRARADPRQFRDAPARGVQPRRKRHQVHREGDLRRCRGRRRRFGTRARLRPRRCRSRTRADLPALLAQRSPAHGRRRSRPFDRARRRRRS